MICLYMLVRELVGVYFPLVEIQADYLWISFLNVKFDL